jgi:ribosomal protein S14
MAVQWTKRNAITKKEYLHTELEKNIIKSVLSNTTIDKKYKLSVYEEFLMFKKVSSISYYRRYCIVNLNGRAVFKHFKLHRLVCKKWMGQGLLIGVRRASF